MSPHVLIVDDDPVVRDLLSCFLRVDGFSVSALARVPATYSLTA
jgi:two-component system, OmpR family, phosphate regulon response regulator OmpR